MSQPAAIEALGEASATLGLRDGQVDLAESNPRWGPLYEDVAAHLNETLGGIEAEIAHIGSTSVPGLPAKPLLDIAIGVRPPIDNEAVIVRLKAGGLDYQLDLGMYGGLFFTAASEAELVVAHVHVVALDDFQWRWYLAFRDGLRDDPELRKMYADLKRNAADAHPTDREAYTKAKFDWVLATVSALADG